MYTFGKKSKQKLATCHPDMIKIMSEVIKISKVDFGVSEGHRSNIRQGLLFLQGKSKLKSGGKHNVVPAMACDIYIYHPDKKIRKKIIYDRSHLSYIGGIVDSVSKDLLEKAQISHRVRWGANWDSDGVIDFDQSFDDYPHFELITP